MTFNKKPNPFCKVCRDAGKTEAEYTSHFVKSEPGPKGKVVCPTLLNLKCTYCQENGHMVSYCITLQKNKKNKEKSERAFMYQSKAYQPTEKKALINRFDALDDEEELEEGEEKDEFPALCEPINAKPEPTKDNSYAFIASKPPVLAEKDAIIVADIPIIVGKRKVNMSCWADDELSDDEDDDFRSKYRSNSNRIVVHDDNKYDNMSDNSYAGYDDDDYYNNYEPDEYDDNEYTDDDAWNSIICSNWKSIHGSLAI
jgi:hypothetical protein